MTEEIFHIADQENYTIAEVLTILRFSQVLDKEYSVKEKYFGRSLSDIWIDIPQKKYWLRIYKEQNKRKKRKRKR